MDSLYLPEHDAIVRWHSVGASGPVVVYLPGLGFPAVGNFHSVATDPALAGTRAVLVDFIGTGSSDRQASLANTLDAHARTVATVIDHLGCGPCSVVGYSFGGSVAIELALARPDLVTQLIIAEGNLRPGGGAASRRIASVSAAEFTEGMLPDMLASLRANALDGDGFSAFVAAAWAQTDPVALHANACALVGIAEDFADRFFALELPRTYVWGEKSLAEAAGKASADNPDPSTLAQHSISCAVLPGVGHDLMISNPRGFAELLGPLVAPGR